MLTTPRHRRQLVRLGFVGLLLAPLMTACSTSSAPTVTFTLGTVHRDLTYCNAQRYDLYIPKADDRVIPLAVFVHGGGMTSGDKSDIPLVLLNALASDGYAVASVNYRLAPDFKWPAQIRDVECAIRYLRANAHLYGINGDEIVAFGTSVGAQLLLLDALTGQKAPWDVGPYPRVSSGLLAVGDMFGPANLTEAASGFSSSDIRDVFGRNNREDLVLASPTHYVTANAPPIQIVQGVHDTKVHQSQSTELDGDLKSAGAQVQLILVQNMGHRFVQVGPRPLDPSLGQIGRDLVSFFDNALSR